VLHGVGSFFDQVSDALAGKGSAASPTTIFPLEMIFAVIPA